MLCRRKYEKNEAKEEVGEYGVRGSRRMWWRKN